MRLSAILLGRYYAFAGCPRFCRRHRRASGQYGARRDRSQQPQTEQTTPPPSGIAPEPRKARTIVVTARKREESLKDVPVAATAITGETIERRGLISVKDVAS